MAEQLDLSAAIPLGTRTTYTVTQVLFNWPKAIIEVLVVGSDGVEVRAEYLGATATTLMLQLNKVDLSVKSLQRRILERLVTDGKLPPGSVSGTPA